MSEMVRVKVRLLDQDLRRVLAALPKQAPRAISKGINKGGRPTSRQFRKVLTKTLGLGTIKGSDGKAQSFATRALRQKSSTPSTLRFSLTAFGPKIPLKWFKAKETPQGVSAAPMNKRRIYPGVFMKGGRFPNRVTLRRGGGHAFKRSGGARLPIEMQRGVAIAEGFAEAPPEQSWHSGADRLVAPAILAELSKIFR
jgi:hypothetical protein